MVRLTAPPKDTSCLGLLKTKWKKNANCIWSDTLGAAFGKASGCMAQLGNACEGVQTKKLCNGDSRCKRTKIFHCEPKKQIPPGNCDCENDLAKCSEAAAAHKRINLIPRPAGVRGEI